MYLQVVEEVPSGSLLWLRYFRYLQVMGEELVAYVKIFQIPYIKVFQIPSSSVGGTGNYVKTCLIHASSGAGTL